MLIELVGYITMIVTIASLIAASTETPKDDVWIGKLYKFIDFVHKFKKWVPAPKSS